MNGNGCAGSIASGVSTGKICPQEVVLQPGPLPLGDVRAVDQHDRPAWPASGAVRASASAGRSPAPRPPRAIRTSCSAGVRPSGLLMVMPSRTWPLQAGDADHEEFVEVVGRDRQEAQPLQQRMASFAASSSTRRLKCSQDSSRLMKRSGLALSSNSGARASDGAGSRLATFLLSQQQLDRDPPWSKGFRFRKSGCASSMTSA